MTTTTAKKTAGAKPDLVAFSQKQDNAPLTRIGAAWSHGKGDGMNLVLDAIPLTGRIVLFPPKDESNDEQSTTS